MRTRFRSAIAFCGLAVSLPIDAHALAPLPPAIYQGSGGAGPNIIYPELTGPGEGVASWSGIGANGQPGSASTNVSLGGSPVPAAAFTDSAGNSAAAGSAEVDYEIEVLGGSATPAPVKVVVSAYATAFGSGDGSAGASVAINDNSALQHIAQWQACSNSAICGGLPSSFNVKTTVTLMSNTLYEVIVAAGGGVAKLGGLTGTEPGTGAADGYADPYFQLAAGEGAYSLAFSPGIGDSPLPSSVPEPGAWTTLMLGAGLLGAVQRRRRREALQAI